MYFLKNIIKKSLYEKLYSPPTTIVSASILDRQEYHS